jgi:hypothetical protein
VRIVLDNVNNDLLASFNQRLFPPFDPYANRADVVKFTSKIVGVLTNPLRCGPQTGREPTRALPFWFAGCSARVAGGQHQALLPFRQLRLGLRR